MKLFNFALAWAIVGGVATAHAADQTLFTSQAPIIRSASDGPGVNYELGMKFIAAKDGSVKGIRFWKSRSETGTHVGRIFGPDGVQLASVGFSSETRSGWQQQMLASPLAIKAGQVYTISVNTGSSYYVASNNGFASQVITADLRSAPGAVGVYGPVGSMPRQSYQRSNYFRDVLYEASAAPTPTPGDTVKPTLFITSPAAGATVSGSAVAVSASASDNVGVAGVQFMLDGANLGAEDTAAPYSMSFNSVILTNGAHTLSPRARDAAGNTAVTTISININNNTTVPLGCNSGGSYLWNNLEACGWPGKGNTGPMGPLALRQGGMTISAPGVYENLDIRGSLTISASNVTVRNFRVTETGGFTSVYVSNGVTNIVFEDCEVNANYNNQFAIWVYSPDTKVTVRRCEIYNVGNAIQVGQGLVFEDNYCHDIDQMPDDGDSMWHTNCVINLNDSRGISNMTIRHNTMRLGSPGGLHGHTAVLNLITQNDVTIENNLMANGAYTVYLFDSRYGGSVPINSKVINNKFSTIDSPKVGVYNIWYPGQGFPDYAPYVLFQGNIVLETGKAVNGTNL